jgi:predicted DNA-binding transcriptional regulator YafY
MRAVTPLAISFQRPARFDLAKHWKRSVSELEAQRRRYKATLLLSSQAAESLIRWCVATPATTHVPDDAPTGWVAMHVDFESEEQALFVSLGMGARVRVMEPRALWQRMAEEVKTMFDAASNGSSAEDAE